MKSKADKSSMTDKDSRRKLYEENKDLYKKVRADFIYGVSTNFRTKRKNSQREFEELNKETDKAYEEDTYEDSNKKSK